WLTMIDQQRDEVALDVRPVGVGATDAARAEVALDARDGLGDAPIVEVDSVACDVPDREPVRSFEMALCRPRTFAEQRVVAVETFEQDRGDLGWSRFGRGRRGAHVASARSIGSVTRPSASGSCRCIPRRSRWRPGRAAGRAPAGRSRTCAGNRRTRRSPSAIASAADRRRACRETRPGGRTNASALAPPKAARPRRRQKEWQRVAGRTLLRPTDRLRAQAQRARLDRPSTTPDRESAHSTFAATRGEETGVDPPIGAGT